MSFWVYITVRW